MTGVLRVFWAFERVLIWIGCRLRWIALDSDPLRILSGEYDMAEVSLVASASPSDINTKLHENSAESGLFGAGRASAGSGRSPAADFCLSRRNHHHPTCRYSVVHLEVSFDQPLFINGKALNDVLAERIRVLTAHRNAVRRAREEGDERIPPPPENVNPFHGTNSTAHCMGRASLHWY